MKYLRKINEYEGVYSRLCTIREKDFKDCLFALYDICEINIEYGYGKRKENGVSIIEDGWLSPNEVNRPLLENQIPTIIIRIGFYNPSNIDKTIEFHEELGEAVDRLKEKYPNRIFAIFRNGFISKKEKEKIPCTGYNIIILDE